MACANYKPAFQKQLVSTDPLGSLNCTCYSGAMAADYHTCGAKVPTGKRVRELTGDKVGGTTLLQVDAALNKGWGVDLDTRIGSSRLTWAQLEAKIDAGRGAIVQGGYDVIRGTKFQGSESFAGNHAVYVPPGWAVMDPLCDGRRAGIYKYHGESYPRDLIRRFAGRLMLDPVTGRRLGIGYVWCSLTKDNIPAYKAIIRPKAPATKKLFLRYYVNSSGIITGRTKHYTGGFSANCTSPRVYKAKSGLSYLSKSLVKLTSGSRSGWYVSSTYAQEI